MLNKHLFQFVACLTLANSYVVAAPVSDALTIELRSLTEDVASIVEKKGGGGIAIGEFTGAFNVKGHVGPGIQLILAQEMERAGISVDNSSPRFELSGRYQSFKDSAENRRKAGAREADATNLLAVKLVATLTDLDTGEPLVERPTGRLIFGSETVPTMLGMPLSIPPLREPRDLSNEFEKANKNLQVNVKGTLVEGRTGLFAMEVIVKRGNEYQAVPLTELQGKPFAELKNSDIYGVRLINNASYDAAVNLRIDGVNCFAFSDSKSEYWIVQAKQSVDILGWHRTANKSTQFKVVSNFPNTAAANLNLRPSSDIGLITAAFSSCWENDNNRPNDEPAIQGRGTGFGNDIKFNTEQVPRTVGQLRDLLAVRYER